MKWNVPPHQLLTEPESVRGDRRGTLMIFHGFSYDKSGDGCRGEEISLIRADPRAMPVKKASGVSEIPSERLSKEYHLHI